MDSRLEAIKARIQELRSAREKKAAELEAAKEKARAAAAAEAEKAAAQRMEAGASDKITDREEYLRAVAECEEIKAAAAADLRIFADSILNSFNEARLEYMATIKEVEGVLQELDENTDPWILKSRPGGLTHSALDHFVGNPDAPGYKTGKFNLWKAAATEFPEPVKKIEWARHTNIYKTPTAHSYEELEAFEKLGLRRYGAVLPGREVLTPAEWLDPSIEWYGSSVETIEPKLDEIPARMDFEGRVESSGNYQGRSDRVIHRGD